MTMKLSILCSALIFSGVDAATKVAVIELGKGGVVRRTTAKDSFASPSGVASFWSALHSPGRKVQHAGMTVVPDLFNKADEGIVVALQGSGVDLASMPFVSGLLSEEGSHGVVGHMEVAGSAGAILMDKLSNVESVDVSSFLTSAKKSAMEPGLSATKTNVDSSHCSHMDSQVDELIKSLDVEATNAGKTVVLHLVVEEEEGSARRRALSRRLEDNEEEEENEEEDGEDNNGDQDGNNNNANGGQASGYYGYGYYNAYGEWVTPYKTMFQIQYFNVVLWTSIGLTVVLFFTIYLMMYMPLMPDTLLFGESAKLVSDD